VAHLGHTHGRLALDAHEPSHGDAAAARAHRKRRLALAYRAFGALRWGMQGDGHISAVDPEHPAHFWVLAYGVPFAEATVDSLVLVGPNGEVAEGSGEVNPAAFYIHAPIHAARPDVVSVAHTHTPWGTPFSAEVRAIPPVTQEACTFFGAQALFDDEEVDIASLAGGARIADALGSHDAIVLRNHGLLTCGPSVDDATGLFLIMERAAESAMKAAAAKPISDEAAEQARDLAGRRTGWRVFNWAVRSLVPDPLVVGGD
jgi:ribulose-5-phosphate 4-epimerase/fuculose-1-phosphate aldolase